VGLITTEHRATGLVSERIQKFVADGFADTLERQPGTDTVRFRAQDTEELVAWCNANRITQLVTAHCPEGPTRTVLDRLEPQWRDAGINMHTMLRDWDRLHWAHADRGFFQFRKNIPDVLGALGMSS